MSVSKSSFRSGPYKAFFAQGVRVGNVLYLSGQVGVDAKGVAAADLPAQIELAYSNIQRVLAQFDATLDNVVDETLFITDMQELLTQAEAIYAKRQQAYGKPPEVCQTVVQVSALLLPELKVEIKCVAHL
ncbi:Enamine deaminase RidA, house cleaning of reactive enamine intermediates, YjgF/YER057c/UK114 family [Pseudomonas pohangensis]|jgi:enamine deaminase RidA (YjgF/YER057c/UK114 family)|uniref:Enamine deaminase RidA, house cleaning of reactive enamine intermediates, YjgF/YER057c/UK114 family n=1 Tax=Pseudomonas pohangensis TaxID=364197 RepID=A0A1H2HKD7_9PSED|nr:Rid family hydrolase [Pseudomonas pohangensis]SDU32242.1 Enamine deaminase RidA, house cleaning of reactive enamine intermediates, YjgF/YER057c/UK114 family [Pseudomonas pohangensis]